MRGVYVVSTQIASLSVAKTVLLGTCPTGTIIEVLEAYLTNSNQALLEQLQIDLSLVATLGTPVGTAITAANVHKTEAGSGDTVVTWTSDITTEPTAYKTMSMYREGIINVAGFKYEPSPEARRFVGSGQTFGLRLLTNPGYAFRAECMITYREIG